MVTVNFIMPSGDVMSVDANVGQPLMQAAVRHDVPGIIAECGGTCSCATCHVYINEDWRGLVGDPGAMEASMLEFTENVEAESRLSCQIRVTEAMGGLTVRVPPAP